MSDLTPRGVQVYSTLETLKRQTFIQKISRWLELNGYQPIEVPSVVKLEMFRTCTEGTENRMFELGDGEALLPEATNYVRAAGAKALGAAKVYYVAKCFRNETTTDSERLREFTQIGVEILGENSLDCRKQVRADAIKVFKNLFGDEGWELRDEVARGLNLYDASGKTFEIHSPRTRKQLLGGGPYEGGAGWALGLERLMKALESK